MAGFVVAHVRFYWFYLRSGRATYIRRDVEVSRLIAAVFVLKDGLLTRY